MYLQKLRPYGDGNSDSSLTERLEKVGIELTSLLNMASSFTTTLRWLLD